MRSSDVGRANTRPLRIEPEAGQVGEHVLEPSSEEPADVLQEDDARSKIANGAGELEPQAGALAVLEPSPRTGVADVLAGEAADDGVGVLGADVAIEVVDVVDDLDRRVLLPDDLAAERGTLTGEDASGSEHVLDGAIEAEDARERGDVRERTRHVSTLATSCVGRCDCGGPPSTNRMSARAPETICGSRLPATISAMAA